MDIVQEAENVIKKLGKDKYGNISLKTNQIRKFLTAVNSISNKVNVYHARHLQENKLPPDLATEIKFLKVKSAYQAGRDKYGAGDFIKKAQIMEFIDKIGDNFQKYQEFARYIEALVAYHKYYGGRDK